MSAAALSIAPRAPRDGRGAVPEPETQARTAHPSAHGNAGSHALLPLGTLPQPWHTIGQHPMLPRLTLDEQARLDALSHLDHFLAQQVVPQLRARFERAAGVEPPADRPQAWSLLQADPRYAQWSHLRRRAMELRQRRNVETVLRQRDELAGACRAALAGSQGVELDPAFQPPAYLRETHAHLLPGGYLTDLGPDDVTAGAAYETSSYAVVPGRSGPHSDGAGRALAHWLRARFPSFRPARILDLGCGAGLNTCAIARAFPDAEILALDAGPGLLRYAAARAAALGVHNVRWIQADIERVPERLGPVDLAFTAIVLHETSHEALQNVFRACHERLAPGGLTLHLEQPPYHDRPWFEQCMRDWDGRYNNESFWSRLYELDLLDELQRAGFRRARAFADAVSAVPWSSDPAAAGRREDYGRTGHWQVVAAWKDDA